MSSTCQIFLLPISFCWSLGSLFDKFLSCLSSVLEGHPVLGTMVPYFLHLLMTAFTVLHSAFYVLKILSYPSPDAFLQWSPIMLCKLCRLMISAVRWNQVNPTEIGDLYLGFNQNHFTDVYIYIWIWMVNFEYSHIMKPAPHAPFYCKNLSFFKYYACRYNK